MKVLLVAPYFEPAVGGAENYALQIVRRLAPTWEIVVVTAGLDGRRSTRIDTVHGYRVEALPVGQRVFNTPMSRQWPRLLREIIARERPDVINAVMPVPGLADVAARAAAGVPFVLTYHNDVVKPGAAGVAASAYYLGAGTGTLRRATRVICHSPDYVAQSPHLDPARMHIDYIPPGVDTDVLVPGDEHLDPTVLFVGNLDLTHAHKGLDVLIAAVAQIPRARLVVVGRGDGEGAYREQAERLGVADRVEFKGFVGDDELPSVYRQARVTVLASTSGAEGFGMVLIESQASGTPVIGARVGGIPAALDEGVTGLLVEPGSVDGLAAALRRVLDSDDLYRRLRSGARAFAEQFSWDVAARRTDETYRKAMRPQVVEVTAAYPPELGGLEAVCATYAEGLAARGWTVKVVTSTPPAENGTGASDRNDGPQLVRRRRLDVGGMPVIPGLYPELTRTFGPAVLHVHLSQAGIPELAIAAGRRRGVPVVIHFHLDVAPSGRFGAVFAAYKRRVLPATLRAADRVVCFSQEQGDFLVRTYGVDPLRIRVVPNGVEPLEGAVRNRDFAGRLNVLFVGRLAPQKRVDVLVAALGQLSGPERFRVKIVGAGPLGDDLAVQAAALASGPQPEFTGRLDGADLEAAFRWADIFVLPSEREGMPLALLEAMSAGLVAVASDAPGMRDFVADGETGLLFEAGNAPALADALGRLADSPETCRELARAGSAWARHQTWAQAFDRIEAVFGELTGHRHSS